MNISWYIHVLITPFSNLLGSFLSAPLEVGHPVVAKIPIIMRFLCSYSKLTWRNSLIRFLKNCFSILYHYILEYWKPLSFSLFHFVRVTSAHGTGVRNIVRNLLLNMLRNMLSNMLSNILNNILSNMLRNMLSNFKATGKQNEPIATTLG